MIPFDAMRGYEVPDTMHALCDLQKMISKRASLKLKEAWNKSLPRRCVRPLSVRTGQVRSGHDWTSSHLDRSATALSGQLCSRLVSSGLVWSRDICSGDIWCNQVWRLPAAMAMSAACLC